VPIRRVTEADVLRASSVRRFGRAPAGRVRRDSVSGGHEVRVWFLICLASDRVLVADKCYKPDHRLGLGGTKRPIPLPVITTA
jgi:hypothetical protein